MNRTLHTKIVLWLILSLASLTSNQSFGQSKLFMNPIEYTDRQLEVYMSPCSDEAKIHLFINNVPVSSSSLRTLFIIGNFYAFEMDFGLMKPGDIFKVTDECGSVPFQQVVKDDYVYVEVPSGSGQAGNGIGPDDAYAPYSKLSTPLPIGKCAPLTIDSHGLVSYYIFSGATTGTFLVNGAPLTNTASTINPEGYDINFNGFQGTLVYTINPNGSITSNTGVKLESNTHFSGDTPLSLEYNHDGVNPPEDLSLGFRAMSFRQIKNNTFELEKASLGGILNSLPYPASPNSKYKITYDGVYYRAYVNNVLIDELRRFVQYDASSGTLTPGSSAGLDYSTPVTWTGMESGNQWVSVLVDGVLYTRQQFKVAEDIIINPSVLDVACNGESNGKITVSSTGGLAPLLYALDNGGFQSNPVFSGLSPGNYVIKVRDASGCTASRNVTVGNPAILTVSVTSKTNTSCSGGTTGSVTLLATGGSSPYLYSKDGINFITTTNFSDLSAGNFTFYVKDDNGCIATLNETLSSNSNLVATIGSLQNVSCNGGNSGAFIISTTGSVVNGTLQYSIDNGSTFQSGNSFAGLSASNYPIVVKDNSCSIALSANISQPGALTINPSQEKAVSCNGLSDGRIKATASSGVSPYLFSIDGTTYSSDSIFTGLAAGNYKVWVKDANGCVKESSIIQVTQPTVVSLSVFNKNDVTCFGGTNGSFTLTGTGGTSPYQYSKDGTTYQASSSFAALSAGTFSLTLKDANGCSATTSGEILQPADIFISASIDNTVSCFGGTNGQIQVVASGGTGLLKYAIDGTTFGNSAIFSGLSAGNYQITVMDVRGCTKASTQVNLSQASQLIPKVSSSTIKCFGGTDGSVTLSATGGTGAYTYSKDGSNYQGSNSFPGLTSGSYTFSVKDASSCTNTIAVNLTQPTDLIVSSSIQQQVLCYNGTNGIILANSSGGTLPYEYSLNGTTYQVSPTFESLAIGTYKVWVKDINGCIKETPSNTLSQPTELLGSIAEQAAVKCFGGNDGSVKLTASGGISPYQFSSNATTFQASPDFTGLAASSINFTIKDGNGCTRQVAAQITQPVQGYSVNLVYQTNLTCFGANIGRIEVANIGGTSPYQVSLDNSQFQSLPAFANLATGTYTIYGKDANNCLFTLPGINITQPSDIIVSLLSKEDVDCEYYQKGEALVGASGSNGNFTYILSGFDFKFNPIGSQSNTTGLFENLSAGDYIVTARDQAGCTKDFPVTIIPKSTGIRFELSKTIPANCQSQDGSISITTTSGGRPPYQYSISSQNTFSANPAFTGLLNGTYIVTVADELCSYKKEVDLSVPGSIKAAYTIDPVSCATPVANLNITSITGGSGTYELSLNGGAFSANRTYANLHPNVYSLTIQDSPLSCKTVVGIEIKEQNRADLQIVTRQDVLCYGGSSGIISVKGDNNVGPFTYAINNGAFSDNGTFSNLPIGTYKLYAKNRIGCLDSLRTTLVQPTELTSTFTKKDNNCFGDQTGALELFANGGTPGYSYSIDGSTYQSEGKFELLTANNYTSYVKDSHGCIATKNIAVVAPPLLTINPLYQDTIRCFGESNGSVNIQTNGGTPSYLYSVNGTDYLPDNLFRNLALGTYQFYAKDVNGCTATKTISLSQPEVLELIQVSKSDPKCYDGKDGTIAIAAKGGNGAYTYTLDNTVSQTDAVFTGLSQASYLIKVTDRRGCTTSLPAIELKWPEKISSQFTTVQPICNGEANGSINLSVSGGTSGYKAFFNGQTYDATSNTFVFEKLSSATYSIDVRDANQCLHPVQVFLEQPSALDGNILITNNKCFSDQTGKIEVSGTGATPGYTYALNYNGYSPNGTFENLLAGSYRVNIKDVKGCVFTKEVQVIQPSLVTVSAINSDTVRCFGEQNGAVKVIALGGTPGYQYSLDGFNYYSDSTFRSMKAGSYRFRVRDSKQCEQSTTLTIGQPTLMDLSLLEKSNPLCAGEQNGKIVLLAAGGNGGYRYWKDNSSEQSKGTFEGLTQAEYTFKVIDRKGCEDTLRSVKLTWPKTLTTRTNWTQPKCFDDANGSITLNLDGGIAPYTVTATGLTPTTNTNQEWKYTNLSAGRYAFNTKDGNGCVAVTSIIITAPDKLNPVSFPESEPVCKGQEVLLLANNPGKLTEWYFNGTPVSQFKNEQELNALEPGLYRLAVSNRTGCTMNYEYNLQNNSNALKADFLMTVQAFVGDTVTVLDISSPTPDEIKWELPKDALTIDNQSSKLAFSLLSEGEYPVKMMARKGDCNNTKIRTIKIFEKDDIDQTDSLLHYQDINIVQEMIVYPNPNFGKFTVKVKLAKTSDLSLAIIRSATNVQIYGKEEKGVKEHTFEIELTNYQQDVYLVMIKAGKSLLYKRALLMN